MPGIVLLGAQWGDEGKGRITDLLACNMDMVVRFQGGNNAGHTVVTGSEEFRLHHIPSGILYPKAICVIGNGVVVNPEVLIQELDMLKSKRIETDNLRISGNAHLVMPYHIILDMACEQSLGKSRIGTTNKGIGPVYADKAYRTGIRVQDLLDLKIFRTKLETALVLKNAIIEKVYGLEPLDRDEIFEKYKCYVNRIGKYITDTALLINNYLDRDMLVLFEGAQGSMLDLDHGTYPFVTSSSTVAGGASVGSGVGPKKINEIIGIAKAYTTRVGSGPFPTEIDGPLCDYLRERGHEYGTTTGRPRRCGWLDILVLKYAVMVNSLDSLAITKIDVLTGLDEIKVCCSYEYEGKIFKDIPPHQTIMHKCTPVYKTFKGWKEDISRVKIFSELPETAQKYIEEVEKLVKVPISMISVGPERSQIIIRDSLKDKSFLKGVKKPLLVR
ncbi:MAG: adenylosuccinate synthase [Actinobacteria bacterium]|nr:adenylosuccinate synthase [Actinomycetota bacterium]